MCFQYMSIDTSKYKNLVFLCGARDFHAMDWYKRSLEKLDNINIFILTDLIQGEDFKLLIKEQDVVFKLIILDKILFRKQSNLGHYWRHFIKILVFPIQVYLIKKFSRKYPNSVFYAHSMYYIWLARFAGIDYVGRPQGSDVLIKPFKSLIFKILSRDAINNSKAIIVDSYSMYKALKKFSNVNKVFVIPNGIDLDSINKLLKLNSKKNNRQAIISIRGLSDLYKIHEILLSRASNLNSLNIPIQFIYPFYEINYKKSLQKLFISGDKDQSRLSKIDMYKNFLRAKLVISIPCSDSSPRSVYEAIFCGAIVAITYNDYYENFPNSIKARVIIVDINNKGWFYDAINKADTLLKEPFAPCKKALKLFDQNQTFNEMAKVIFK